MDWNNALRENMLMFFLETQRGEEVYVITASDQGVKLREVYCLYAFTEMRSEEHVTPQKSNVE